ncbi:3-oxoacyl-[acyl-carrier-protein] reductase [Paenibacillus polysaccharolyticus]|uniref:3-oxoacyl-[acyl-carrier-protein] reductase n=1 Tax=Paenibacillus polysaccharolyticus TaxID=582692 RepID=A0A1G5BDJ1_9BACL|nr:3-oxoacyl-[acyl-carrier-protein] reductase [Paenibacillus polysaccharolyticus]SCX88225.1 3-oxoacyl-[acyl-carrier-protein] reductase [Paenibacillus polysaccharolyticus]
MDFQNKIVLITGGSRGIGNEITRQFAFKGAVVIFTYSRSKDEATKLEAELCEKGCVCESILLDVTNHNKCMEAIEYITKKYKKIDVLINNAGVTDDSFLMFMDEMSWDSVINTNLKGTYNCSKAVIPSMLSEKEGVIINISSVSGQVGGSGQTNYSASKAGVIGFTKALSRELARKKIRVNSVAPGYIATDMLNKVPEKIKHGFKDKISVGRFGEAAEVAKVVLFLASDDASYIHGQVINVDGGIV